MDIDLEETAQRYNLYQLFSSLVMSINCDVILKPDMLLYNLFI